MLSESLRQRLEQLNRQGLPATPARRPLELPEAAHRSAVARTSLLSGAGVTANSAGEHLVIRAPLDEFWQGGERRVAGRVEHLQSLDEGSLASGVGPFVDSMPDGALLLDLETCGLGGAAIFLVGVLRLVDDQWTVELLLARNYAEERALMESLWDRIDASQTVVTYNGKSFDWPAVMDRSRRHLLHKSRRLNEPPHVDFLHAARRRWKGQVPDCKLQTIERLVCRRARAGDIPGNQIPAAYDAYVRTGDATEIEAILRHNALDLVTLLDIAMRVAA